jgi:hypothetical protein
MSTINAMLSMIFLAQSAMDKCASFTDFKAALDILSELKLGIFPIVADDMCLARQRVAEYLVTKTSNEYLIFADIGVQVPMNGVDWLLSQITEAKDVGVMVAPTFWWPDAMPNITKLHDKEKKGQYTFPIYVPDVELVLRCTKRYHDINRGTGPQFFQPGGHLWDVESFRDGLFIIRRDVLEKMDGLYFHKRKGDYMGEFCNRVRALGYKVQGCFNLICSNVHVNHIAFLEHYGGVKDE